MAVTPEGRVKKEVNLVLDDFVEDLASPRLYRYWPVPSGFGKSSLDCIVCYYGVFIAIETKAPGLRPTPRQAQCISDMNHAGGMVFVIYDDDGCAQLRSALELIRLSHAK